MIKVIISDFSRVILFPKETSYIGSLNKLHEKLFKSSEYSILNYFDVNKELLDFYQSLKGNIRFYIFTTGLVQDDEELQPHLKPIFEKVYSSFENNLSKRDSASYKKVVDDINVLPGEAIYIDDTSEYVRIAGEAGLKSIQFTSNQDLFLKVKEILKDESKS